MVDADRRRGRIRASRSRRGRAATSSTTLARRPTGDVEVLTRRASSTNESQNDVKDQLGVLQHVPARVRRHRAARRLVHHLQHVLDHRRPAQAARWRCCARIGAGRRQVLGSVLFEAVLVGVVASIIGFVAGIAARPPGSRRCSPAFGFDIPASEHRDPAERASSGRSSSGMVVTIVGGAGPGVQASRIPPIAALRDRARSTARQSVGVRIRHRAPGHARRRRAACARARSATAGSRSSGSDGSSCSSASRSSAR